MHRKLNKEKSGRFVVLTLPNFLACFACADPKKQQRFEIRIPPPTQANAVTAQLCRLANLMRHRILSQRLQICNLSIFFFIAICPFSPYTPPPPSRTDSRPKIPKLIPPSNNNYARLSERSRGPDCYLFFVHRHRHRHLPSPPVFPAAAVARSLPPSHWQEEEGPPPPPPTIAANQLFSGVLAVVRGKARAVPRTRKPLSLRRHRHRHRLSQHHTHGRTNLFPPPPLKLGPFLSPVERRRRWRRW